jgi:hypothetical protein
VVVSVKMRTLVFGEFLVLARDPPCSPQGSRSSGARFAVEGIDTVAPGEDEMNQVQAIDSTASQSP